MALFFFNRIKIPGKGFMSGHWSGAGGDGHRLLNKKQRRRREVHRGQPLLPYRRVKGRKKGGGGDKMESISMKSTIHEGCLEGLRRKRQAGE